MQEEYKYLPQELYKQAYGNAWSMESMEAHGAEERNTEYIGSRLQGNIIYDYYRDSAGAWWYSNRAVVAGEIVSMEVYIFGHEIKRERRRTWNQNY